MGAGLKSGAQKDNSSGCDANQLGHSSNSMPGSHQPLPSRYSNNYPSYGQFFPQRQCNQNGRQKPNNFFTRADASTNHLVFCSKQNNVSWQEEIGGPIALNTPQLINNNQRRFLYDQSLNSNKEGKAPFQVLTTSKSRMSRASNRTSNSSSSQFLQLYFSPKFLGQSRLQSRDHMSLQFQDSVQMKSQPKKTSPDQGSGSPAGRGQMEEEEDTSKAKQLRGTRSNYYQPQDEKKVFKQKKQEYLEKKIQEKGEPVEQKDQMLKNHLIALKFITSGKRQKGLKILKADLKQLKKSCTNWSLLLKYQLEYVRIFNDIGEQLVAKNLLEDTRLLAMKYESQNVILKNMIEQKMWQLSKK